VKPVDFPEANGTLYGGDLWPYPVMDIPVWRTPTEIVSCWQMSFADRLRSLIFGRVWFRCLTTTSHPPILLETSRPMDLVIEERP
jgi:hypothetical protein